MRLEGSLILDSLFGKDRMAVVIDILKELFPFAWDAIKDGLRNIRTSKRRRLQLFMLKAIGYEETGNIIGRPFSVEQIERKLFYHQIEDIFGDKDLLARAALHMEITPEETLRTRRRRKIQIKLGIPQHDDPKRTQKLEEILQDMVQAGKLRFHPPSSYSVV